MKKIFFISIAFTILVSSCTEDIDNAFDVKNNGNLYDLSENEVLKIAETFQKSVTSHSKTRIGDIAFDIKSSYRLNASGRTRSLSDEELPLIYEIAMNDGRKDGKIIISGDKRCPEVLAYIPSFNDSLYKESSGPNIMVQMAKNSLLEKIHSYNDISPTRSYPVESVPGEVSVMIVPFCSTGWSQYIPYNQLFPKAWIEYTPEIPGQGHLRPGEAWYRNYPTGEATVAIAQAMAYLKPNLDINGMHIDWNALTIETDVTAPNENMVATLFKYIYDTIGTYPVWGKSYKDTWPTGSPRIIVDAIIRMETPIKNISRHINSSHCGITCDNDQNWNLEVVKKSLISLHPVLAGNLCRAAFLVDGYAIKEDNTLYLHCNFGREEEFNGYYLVNNDGRVSFDTELFFYRDSSLGIIPNIRKRL